MNQNVLRVALFGVGLETYWPQFKGLHERLIGYQDQIAQRLQKKSTEILNLGLVDSPLKAQEAASSLAKSDVDLVFLYISTYALSSTVLPVVQKLGVPIIILNLQPVPQLDYESFNQLGDRGLMTGRWLEHCQSCSAPEIASVFNRVGIPFHLISGYLEDPEAWNEISDWLSAARVALEMRKNRVGVLGHYYGGMLDVYSDLTQQSGVFGNHFEILEMDELLSLRNAITEKEILDKITQFKLSFEVSPECEQEEIIRAAKTSCALDSLIQKHQLGSLAYYYEGEEGTPHRDLATSVIAGNTLLTGAHIPVAGECEIKNVQAMKILDLLNAGGSFSEFYLTDFIDDVVFWGHDGPAHFAIAEGRVGLVPLPIYHGKPGKGLSIQMAVRQGPVTLLSVIQQAGGKLALLVAEGESVAGVTLQIGNTNSRYRFSIGAKRFMNEWSEAGPAHHCAIGVGHLAHKIEKLSKILKIPMIQIC